MALLVRQSCFQDRRNGAAEDCKRVDGLSLGRLSKGGLERRKRENEREREGEFFPCGETVPRQGGRSTFRATTRATALDADAVDADDLSSLLGDASRLKHNA